MEIYIFEIGKELIYYFSTDSYRYFSMFLFAPAGCIRSKCINVLYPSNIPAISFLTIIYFVPGLKTLINLVVEMITVDVYH